MGRKVHVLSETRPTDSRQSGGDHEMTRTLNIGGRIGRKDGDSERPG